MPLKNALREVEKDVDLFLSYNEGRKQADHVLLRSVEDDSFVKELFYQFVSVL